MADRDPRDRARDVRLAVFDVDGVLTDGRLYLGPDGFEMKVFHTRDGHGLKELMRNGVEVAILSGRTSEAVTRRMTDLGIRYVFQGHQEKRPVFRELRDELALAPEQCAYLGDDTVDLPVMRDVGLAGAVADAHPAVIDGAHWVSRRPGGFGAAREFCELILEARGANTHFAGN